MYALYIFLAIIIVLLLAVILTYNKLITLKKRVKNAWAQIDVQLKRRYDLIPNLVNAVKGYMDFEKETLQKVIEARSKAMNASAMPDKMQAEGELSGMLSRLMAVVEQYPDLKASQNVRQLMEELSNTENKIGFARQFYNDLTTQFNTKIRLFPVNIIASTFNFEPYPWFELENEEERKAPEVNL